MDNIFEIRDIAPPVDSLPSPSAWLWALAVLMVLAVIAFRVFHRKAGPEPVIDPLPPPPTQAEIALRALDSLMAEQLIEAGETKRFFTKLNMILRVFIRDQFKVPALWLTTGELTDSACLDPVIGDESRESFELFLGDCDLFKFADISAHADIALQACSSCRGLVIALAKETE